MFKAFRKIGQYKDAIKAIQMQARFSGLDDDGHPTYNDDAEMPVLVFKGTVKLHGCVSSETLVTLADGSTEYIKNLEVGDSILSYDQESKDFVFDEVTAVIYDELEKDWVELEWDNGNTLKCTEDHPVLTSNGYVPAKDLEEKDEIITF